jgi:hypothetical protein
MNHNVTARLPYIIAGPYNPMFFRYANLVESAIKKMNLVPYVSKQIKEKSLENTQISLDPIWWKYGGIKVPHLHLHDQVYILNDEQWKTFSKTLLSAFKTQLEKASAVSFENAQVISSELENITL